MKPVSPDDLRQNSHQVSLEDPEVIEAVNRFLLDLERGTPVDRQPLLDRFPDIATELAACLDGMVMLHRVTPHLQPPEHETHPPKTSPPSQLVATLGDFRLTREIGRGGMGIVYEAEQLSLGRRVALKVLPFAAMLDERQLQRFKIEAQAAASLHHAHVVPVFGIGADRGVHYYAMQYIEGQTLAELIRELAAPGSKVGQKPPPEPLPNADAMSGAIQEAAAGRPVQDVPLATAETVRTPQAALSTEHSTNSTAYFRSMAELAVDVAHALQHAHEEGILHRDIKPSNLILDARGKVWVTDFGLARMQADPGMTTTGDIVGTLRYMSPEQARANATTVDERTDVYSLCATLYEMLTLGPVFAGDDRQELIRQVVETAPRPLRQLNAAVPADLETIVLKGLEKTPADRYESAEQLAADLRRFLNHEPIRARRPSWGQRTVKWSRRHPAVVWSSAIILLVAMLATTASTVLLSREARRVKEQWGRAEHAEANATRAAETARAINRFLTEHLLIKADPQQQSETGQVSFDDAVDSAAHFAEQAFPQDPQLKGALYQTIGGLYSRLGKLEKSEQHYRAALALLGPTDDNLQAVLETKNGLADTLRQLGRYDHAEPLSRQTLQQSRQHLGDDAATTLDAVQTLGLILLDQGQLPEANVLCRQSWETRRRLLGDDHPDTAVAAVHLARVLAAADNASEAGLLLRQAVDNLRKQRGSDDPQTLAAMADLASLRRGQGDAGAAETLHREILQTRIRIQGPSHSQTLDAMSALADLLRAQRNLPESQSLLQQILNIRQRRLGADHADTLATKDRLAKVLWEQGHLDKSAALYTAIRRESSPEEQREPAALEAANEYAIVLESLGRYADAEPLLRVTWDVARQTLGVEHPTARVAFVRLLISLYAQRKLGEAEPLAQQKFRFMLRIPDNAAVNALTGLPEAIAMSDFAYRRPNRFTEPLLRQSLQYKRDTLPPGHLSIATTLAVLGRDLLANNRPGAAEPLFRESLSTRRQALPAENWLIAETRSLLGECLTELGRFEQARPLLEQSFKALADSTELRPALKLELLQRVVTLYDRWEKPEQRQKWNTRLEDVLRQCLADYEVSLPDKHALIFDLRSRLGECLTLHGQYETAEPLLLEAYANQGVALTWGKDPYTTDTRNRGLESYATLQRIVTLYDGWPRPEQASRWLALLSRHSNTPQAATIACHEAGIAIWEQLAQSDPDSRYQLRPGRAYADLGLAQLRNGDPAESLVAFQRAADTFARILDTEPHNLQAVQHLSACHLAQADAFAAMADHAEVHASLERAVEVGRELRQQHHATPPFVSPGASAEFRDAPARLALFLANAPDPSLRDPAQALRLAEEAGRSAPGSYVASLAAGLASYRSGNAAATLEQLTTHTRSTSRLVRAMAHWKLGDRQAARFHYDEVARERSKTPLNRAASTTPWHDLEYERLFDEASELLGIQDSARQALVAYRLGRSLLEQGDIERAIQSFEEALHSQPFYPEAHFELANCHKAQGDMDAALDALRAAIRQKPDYVAAYYNLGTATGQRGNLDEAIQALKKAVELAPDYAAAHNNLAHALELTGEFAAAADAYSATIKASPGNAKHHDNLASLLATCQDPNVRDPRRAVAIARKATQLAPQIGDYWYTLGTALEADDAARAAADAYARAIDLSPENPKSLNDLAWLLATCPDLEFRDPERAVRLATTATKLAPECGTYWNTLGVAYYRAAHHRDAIEALEKSVALSQGGSSYDHFFLAMAHWQLDEPDQAQELYKKAVAWMNAQSSEDSELSILHAEATELRDASLEKQDQPIRESSAASVVAPAPAQQNP